MGQFFPSFYDLRLQAFSVLREPKALSERTLAECLELSQNIKDAAKLFVSPEARARWFALSLSIVIVKRLDLWLEGRRMASPDALAQKDAAHALATEASENNAVYDAAFLELFNRVPEIISQPKLKDFCASLGVLTMPMIPEEKSPNGSGRFPRDDKNKQTADPKLAFLNFEINGEAARNIDSLEAGKTYDLNIDLRLTHWPENATNLVLTPISMEPENTFHLPSFDVSRAEESVADDGTYRFRRSGRMIIRNPEALGARPYEFSYHASFEPSERFERYEVVGHRVLRLESIDRTSSSISGYFNIDTMVIRLRSKIRAISGVGSNTVGNSVKLLAALGNIAQQALNDAIFKGAMSEKEFQAEVLKILRSNPQIGQEIEAHPGTGGGVTDLSFHRLRIEFKVDEGKGKFDDRLNKYRRQAAQYAASDGAPLAFLCVLAPASLSQPTLPAHEEVEMIICDNTIPVISIIMRRDLPLPSSFSR